MRYLAIKELEHYQHYKERRPPWVKLHQDILESVTFTCLHDASKAHAMLLILIASRYDNRIPWDAAWVGRAIHATDPVDLDVLIASGYLVDAATLPALEVRERDASKPLARRKQSASPKRLEVREQNNNNAVREPRSAERPAPRPAYSPEFEDFWSKYPAEYRGSKKPAGVQWEKRLSDGYTAEVMRAGADRYIPHCRAMNRHLKNASTFLGPDLHFLEPWPLPAGQHTKSGDAPRILRATEMLLEPAA